MGSLKKFPLSDNSYYCHMKLPGKRLLQHSIFGQKALAILALFLYGYYVNVYTNWNYGGNMKKLITFLSVVMFLLVTGLLHAGQFGAAKPIANPGKLSLGGGYFYSQTEWESFDIEFANVMASTGSQVLKSNQVYLQGSYAFSENLEEYVRFGGANASDMLNDHTKIFGTFGLRSFFKVNDWFAMGPFIQFSAYSDYKDMKSYPAVAGVVPATATVLTQMKNPWDFNIGLTLQTEKNGFIVYGGPVVYWQRARVDTDLKVAVGNASVGMSDSVNVYEKANMGAFLGVTLPLTKQLRFEIEGQYKGKASVGGILCYSF